MLINGENLRGLAERFLAIHTVESTKPPQFDRSAFVLPLTGNVKVFDLTFLLDYPTIHEWIGDKEVEDVSEGVQWQAKVRKKEATIEVERIDILTDQLALVRAQIAKMGTETSNYPGRLFTAALEAGDGVFNMVDNKGRAYCRAVDGKSYDGLNLFAATHKLGANTINNKGTSAWSVQAAIDTRKTMRAWKAGNGLLLGVNPTVIMCGMDLVDTITRDIASEWESGTADRDVNRIRNQFTVVYNPYITEAGAWYMLDPDRGQEKPILETVVSDNDLAFRAMEDPNSQITWSRDVFQYSVQGYRHAQAGFPWAIYKNKP